MHIIFGKEQADELANKYTVLELDTFQFGKNGPIATAYCLVEKIPFTELSQSSFYSSLHKDLMHNYQARAWQECLSALQQLRGKWGGEVDSFYEDIRSRVDQLRLYRLMIVGHQL